VNVDGRLDPKLRPAQVALLRALDAGPRSTRELSEALGWTVSRAHHVARRLEDRELVRRTYEADRIEWQLTARGRERVT